MLQQTGAVRNCEQISTRLLPCGMHPHPQVCTVFVYQLGWFNFWNLLDIGCYGLQASETCGSLLGSIEDARHMVSSHLHWT